MPSSSRRRTARPFVLAGLVLAVLVLGTIGFHRLALREGHYGVWDSFFRALRLFGLEGIIEPRLPWELLVAGILGPILTGYAAALALLRLFHEQVQVLGIRVFGRGHVVVAGLGTAGTRLAHAFDARGRRVVAIERDEAVARASGCAERGIPVLVGSAADPVLLEHARVATADALIVTCGDDGTNLDVSVLAGRLVPSGRPGRLTTLVHIGDLGLLRGLTADALRASRPGLRREYFNVQLAAASALVEQAPPGSAANDGEAPHLCVVGLEELGQSVLLRLAGAWRARSDGTRLRLAVVASDAYQRLSELVDRHPELDSICDFTSVAASVETAALHPDSTVDRVYVCLPSASQALGVALGFHRRVGAGGTEVVVALPEADSGAARALTEGDARDGSVKVFGILDAALTPAVVLNGTTELIARAKHADYVRAEAAKGIGPAQNPSTVPWAELPESLRDSNRRFADGVGAILRALRCVVLPAPLIDPRGPLLELGPGEIEVLAKQEHERWRR
ncbi:MAG: hypothetical protein QOK31_1072, partial [Solirubrobacteraceae bacterium]|nr:hypothetical protein [Solirubrobacteraceae bacterium]